MSTFLKKEIKDNHTCDNKMNYFVKYSQYIMCGILFLSSSLIYYCIKHTNGIEQKEIYKKKIAFKEPKQNIKRLQYLAHKQFEIFKVQFEEEYPLNSYDTTFVGDFTNDRLLDVALYYRLKPNQGDYHTEEGILLFENNGNGISFYQEYYPSYLFTIDQISNSRIILNRLEKNDDFVSHSEKKVRLKIIKENRIEEDTKR